MTFCMQGISQDSLVLKKIEIKSARIISNLNAVPVGITKQDYTLNSIQHQAISLQDFLITQPGIYSQNATNFVQDLRISIRGFGARSAFGIRGVRLLVDGIPESTPDGQGQLDNLNLSLIRSMEVLRGPSSSLYGNASGGVIQISTIDDLENSNVSASSSVGSFGTYKNELITSIRDSNYSLLLSASSIQTDGFREHSESTSQIFNAKYKQLLSKNTALRFNANFAHSPEAEDPGGINLEDVESERTLARQRNIDFDAGESIKHLKLSTSFERTTKKTTLNSSVFYHRRKFDAKLPFVVGAAIDLTRNYVGNSSTYQIKSIQKNLIYNFLIGYDAFFQNDRRIRFNNNMGTVGDQTLNQLESFTNLAAYVTNQFNFNSGYNIHFDLRFDDNKIAVTDDFGSDGDNSSSTNYNALNFAVGLSYSQHIRINPFLRIASSYETPVLSELSANPIGGGFNLDLKPIRSVNFEIGAKGKLLENFNYQTSLFRIESSNEILPFELQDFPGRDFFRNAGSTSRTGLECMLEYDDNNTWTSSLSYTFSNFKFKDYVLDNENLRGNLLPGIPQNTVNFRVRKEFPFAVSVTSQNQIIGMLYAEDKNAVVVPSYFRSDFLLQKTITIRKGSCTLSAGMNNLFNVQYFDNIRLNAFGARFYEAAPGRNFYLGVNVKF